MQNSSLEELIELSDLSKCENFNKLKRQNKVHSPKNQSPSPSSQYKSDIVSLFSVKSSPKKIRKQSNASIDTGESQSISEFSDDVFVKQKSESNLSKSEKSSKSYKEKIRNRFKNIKQQAGMSSQKANVFKSKFTLPLERVRKESVNIDAEVESARSRYNLSKENLKYKEKLDFFTKVDTQLIEEDKDASGPKTLFHLTKAERLQESMEISEKELTFIPNSKNVEVSDKLESNEPRYIEAEGLYVEADLKIQKSHLNIVEHRLLMCENKSKWFNCDGTLGILSNPIKDRSIKPENDIVFNEPTLFSQPVSEEGCSGILVIKENTLNLKFGVLKFKHHPLFSIEHVLVRKLEELYEEYIDLTENNKLQRIKNQLEALRLVKSNVEKILDPQEVLTKGKSENYIKEIKHLRELYFKENKRVREILKQILNIWKAVKKIRNDKGYSCTSAKLSINKEKSDYATEKEAYDKFFEETFKEIIDEKKKHYKSKVKAYNQKLEAAKEQQKSDSDDDTSENMPRKPSYDIDEEKISYELKKKIEQSFKPPGEPHLQFKLSQTHIISSDINQNEEIARQRAVSSSNICLKVYCNQIPVCKTKQTSLNDNFQIDFKENLSIQMTEIPKSLTVNIVEYPKGLLKKKICNFEINLPSDGIFNKSCSVHFDNKDIVHYKHEGVGSGKTLKDVLPDFDIKNENLNTCGVLSYEIGWKKVLDKEMSSGIDCELLDGVIDKYGAVNVEKLKEWMEQDVPDPQDPKNSILYEYFSECKYLKTNKECKQGMFRLSPYMGNFNFCDKKVIEDNVRIQMLKLRDQNEVEFNGLVIPNRIKEIPVSILNAYKRRKSTEEKGLSLEIDEYTDRRSFGKKYLTEVYTRIYQKCKNTDNHLTYESVVDERYLIYFEWQPKMPEPLPKIASMKKTEAHKENIRTEQTQITIKILTGKNMPNRKEDTFTNEKFSENLIQPFLEISYENISVRTGNAVGTSPVWNETVILPLDCQHTDYLNPNSLTGTIHIDIFDESDFEVRKFDNRKQCNWLGDIQIPLSAITSSNNLLKGLFKVRLASLLLGYETEIYKQMSKIHKPINNLSSFYAYIDLEISLKPSVPKLWPNMEELGTNELPYIYDHILQWNELYNANYPNRKFSALVLDTQGKSNCIIKYIRPLEPPQLANDEYDVTSDMCVRYVSMIPFYEGNEFHNYIWLTTDQLVNLMIGSQIDHAVALTCYFLALKIDAWLLLGYGSDVGFNAYVLVREYIQDAEIPTYYIYDAVSADKYNKLDPLCPLQRVYCLVTGDNVWANTQRIDSLAFTCFDLNRKSNWLPLFDDNVCAPTNFLNNKITYKLREDTEALELYLEQKIRKKFSKLRQLDRTIWNYEMSSLFKSYLRVLEIDAIYSKSNNEVISDINKSLRGYKVNGCVFNASYTSMSSLMNRIKSLNIHIQKDGSEEFSLSVYLQAYPGQIYSIWIFIACLET